eukprot:Awhi_evm1s11958
MISLTFFVLLFSSFFSSRFCFPLETRPMSFIKIRNDNCHEWSRSLLLSIPIFGPDPSEANNITGDSHDDIPDPEVIKCAPSNFSLGFNAKEQTPFVMCVEYSSDDG